MAFMGSEGEQRSYTGLAGVSFRIFTGLFRIQTLPPGSQWQPSRELGKPAENGANLRNKQTLFVVSSGFSVPRFHSCFGFGKPNVRNPSPAPWTQQFWNSLHACMCIFAFPAPCMWSHVGLFPHTHSYPQNADTGLSSHLTETVIFYEDNLTH